MGGFKDEPFDLQDGDDVSLSACSDISYGDTQKSVSTSEGDEPERDERKEVYKMSSKDTRRVQLWRVAVTVVLLLTACAVTATTYAFLKREETNNFETAFEQFSRTLAEAAIQDQRNIRDTLHTLASAIGGHAIALGQSWPNVDVSTYELYAGNALAQAPLEFINFLPRVEADQVEDYLGFMNASYEHMVHEAHMIKYGDLSHFMNDTMFYPPYIGAFSAEKGYGRDVWKTEYFPNQRYSPPTRSVRDLNHNLGALPNVNRTIQAVKTLHYETVFTPVNGRDTTGDRVLGPELHAAFHSKVDGSSNNPHGYAIHPVHEDPTDPYNSKIVALLAAAMAFDASLRNLLPEGVEGIVCVIASDQNQTISYEIVGNDAYFLGEEDLHEPKYAKYQVEADLALHTNPLYKTTPGHSQYKMYIYPTDRFRETYDSNTPEIFAFAVAVTFVLVAIVFFVYDLFVFKRNKNLVAKAAQSNAIVTSLFPEHMRERLMHEKEEDQMARDNANKKLGKSLKDGSFKPGQQSLGKPMADLYLETTVLFADITGFTAWSSVREPASVFTLLETIFHAFDQVARRRKVFKVETVGDCYVAVAGLPEPREDHAVLISRFASIIITKFHGLTKQLEVSLGPDTGDLELRVGIHSGQVTAGVLRGDRARFQLFGDTMNVCQRVEASGKGGRIHASKETAEMLRRMGREAWLEKRSEAVKAKGVGMMETFWVNPTGDRAGSVASRISVDEALTMAKHSTRTSTVAPIKALDARMNRLISWNCEMLLDLMQQIVARRLAKQSSQRSVASKAALPLAGRNPLDEVAEVIVLPAFDATAAARQQDPATVKISQEVVKQLHLLVEQISQLYNDNPFHNFDHASHVVMSVIKLLSRIVDPRNDDNSPDGKDAHHHTFGITSDPLTQFACAFSALIHDVGHVGVSNAQLVTEGVDIAIKYNGRSVAEQNSLDVSMQLLMEDRFAELRAVLIPTKEEQLRFRQLVVNSVMATDIVDKDLKSLRNARWDRAFKTGEVEAAECHTCPVDQEKDTVAVNRKATIVIEHIIQASDISHTMQHWHVYRKWNQNLFEELYVAYLNGRMEKDPSTFWWKGEFGFFDFYIIPLTRKLKECGVFGVSSDEFLNYATKNREMWELHGEEAVAEMVAEARRKFGVKHDEEPAKEQQLPEQAPPLPPARFADEVDC